MWSSHCGKGPPTEGSPRTFDVTGMSGLLIAVWNGISSSSLTSSFLTEPWLCVCVCAHPWPGSTVLQEKRIPLQLQGVPSFLGKGHMASSWLMSYQVKSNESSGKIVLDPNREGRRDTFSSSRCQWIVWEADEIISNLPGLRVTATLGVVKWKDFRKGQQLSWSLQMSLRYWRLYYLWN